MSAPKHLRDRLSDLVRYFFVKAPSRDETHEMIQTESAKMHQALNRLDVELAHLDKIVRPKRSEAQTR